MKWQIKVMGGVVTVCCLAGFKVRQGSMYVLVADDNVVLRHMDGQAIINPGKCRKVLVNDLYNNAKPMDSVNLQFRDFAENVVTNFVKKYGCDPGVWDDLTLIRSASMEMQLKETLKQQRKAMQRKQKMLKDEEVKKNKLKQAALKQAKDNENRRRKQMKEQQDKRRYERERKATKRKRDKELKVKAERRAEAQAAKIQRVALVTLKAKHEKEMKKMQDDLNKLTRELENCRKQQENEKYQLIIQGLRDQIETIKKIGDNTPRSSRPSKQNATPQDATPRPPAPADVTPRPLPVIPSRPRRSSRAATPRPPFIAPTPTPAPTPNTDSDLTPYDPEVILYDPTDPPYVEPAARTPQFLRPQSRPTRRQLSFLSPGAPPRTYYRKGGAVWHYY